MGSPINHFNLTHSLEMFAADYFDAMWLNKIVNGSNLYCACFSNCIYCDARNSSLTQISKIDFSFLQQAFFTLLKSELGLMFFQKKSCHKYQRRKSPVA
jgi:hypothetical protein